MQDGGPLAGVRVLEVAAYISGPYCGAILASLGADVVKIEPLNGEAFRIGQGSDSPFFIQYNAGKRSVALDLKSPSAIEAVKEMLPDFDVLIENMRPGKMESLGLGRDACIAINPGLIYTSISGFGSDGPWVDRPAYDSIGQAIGGLYTVMNDPDNVRLNGTCAADLITAVSTSVSILAGLFSRERTPSKKGVGIETSVLEAMSMLTVDAMTQALALDIDPVRDTRHPQSQSFCLKTASDDYIIVHLSSSDRFWRGLLGVVQREDLLADPRYKSYALRSIPENYQSIVAVMKEEFPKYPLVEWERRLIEADVPFSPALTMRQVASHPQVATLEILQPTERGFPLIRLPWRFDGTRPLRGTGVPGIGEHTRSVLGEFLSAERIEELQAAGAIAATEREVGP